MRKIIAASFILMVASHALAATAYFTGNQRYVTSAVTGAQLLQCEYAYGDAKLWVTTKSTMCPMSIEVE